MTERIELDKAWDKRYPYMTYRIVWNTIQDIADYERKLDRIKKTNTLVKGYSIWKSVFHKEDYHAIRKYLIRNKRISHTDFQRLKDIRHFCEIRYLTVS